jgi:hypothetical protein
MRERRRERIIPITMEHAAEEHTPERIGMP